MKLQKIEIAEDTFIYVEKAIYNKLKKNKQAAIGIPCGFFTTGNKEVIEKIKGQFDE